MHKNTIFLITLLIGSITGITSDIYAPSIPAISHDLRAPLNEAQWSIAIFMIGVSLSQLFYGPLSEGIGRKTPLIAGLLIMIAGSILCLYAPTIEILLAGRLIQGLGCGAGSSLWRAISRDIFHGDQLSKFASYRSIAMIFLIPVSPTLGGYLEEWFGWRSTFLFLLLLSGIILLIVIFFYKETNPHFHREKLSLKFYKEASFQLLSSRQFMGYTLCTFFCFGGFYSWFVIGPVLLIELVGITPAEFGWICSVGGISSMALGGFLNGRLVTSLGSATMLRLGFIIMMTASILMVILHLIYGINTTIIAIPYGLFLFGATFIWPNTYAGAFTPFGKIAGYAGALFGVMQIGGAALIGSFAAFLPDTNQLPLATIYFLCPLAAWITFEKLVKN